MDVAASGLSLSSDDSLFLVLNFLQVRDVTRRWFQLRDDAIEVFLSGGSTCFFSFSCTDERNGVFEALSCACLRSGPAASDSAQWAQQQWLEGRLTNFEYLMRLNTLAGRSHNDLMQYPVFPFILAQYTEPTLDLNDSSSYRHALPTHHKI